MTVIIVSIHIVVCILLIMVVLLQAGKGSGMGSALTGSSQEFLDSGSATSILTKATTMAAVIFMITSLTMGYMHRKKPDSIMNKLEIANGVSTINHYVDDSIENLDETNKLIIIEEAEEDHNQEHSFSLDDSLDITK